MLAATSDARARFLRLLLRRLRHQQQQHPLLPAEASSARPSIVGRQCATGRGYASSSAPAAAPGVGFVFDIDGVLRRGASTIPSAAVVRERLVDAQTGRWRVPAIFLTNGGGMTEAAKARELSEWLEAPVSERQVALSHTPFKHGLARRLRDRPVLVAGRGDVGAVARDCYGLRAVVTTRELALADPSALPFRRPGDFLAGQGDPPGSSRRVTGEGFGAGGDRGGDGGGGDLLPALPPPHHWGTPLAPFAAVLVFSDPHDWYADFQLLIDTAATSGAPLPAAAAGDAPAPPPGAASDDNNNNTNAFEGFYFSNPDMEFAGTHPRPRFGQGSFACAFAALHRALVEGERRMPPLRAFFCGKPTAAAARLAETLLVGHAAEIGVPGAAGAAEALEELARRQPSAVGALPLRAEEEEEEEKAAAAARRELLTTVFPAGIYMVGDNPRADVRGARRAGAPWTSVLVRTGVFGSGGGGGDDGRPFPDNDVTDPADVVVADVRAAVEAALHRARAVKWHSLR
jgi:HAD superfamily hydrolase (TIGR01450 family)